MLAHPT